MIRATVVRDPTSKLVSSASDAEEPLSGKSCQSQRPSGFAGRAHAVLLNTGRMAKYGHLLKSPSAGEDGKKNQGPVNCQQRGKNFLRRIPPTEFDSTDACLAV